jgi:2-dehydro-3-deoxy-L-rhamnonate dehydrogenase (NAD+)
MIRYDFTDRVLLVTGGASGIGRAVAERFLASGGRVAILDLRSDAVEATARELGNATLPVMANVTKSAEIDAAVALVESELGRVDALVCCAGVSGDSLRTTDVADDEWERVFAVNCHGVFYCNRAVIPGMQRRGYGRIVNIASIAGKEGNPMAAAYSSSKAAVIAMTKAIGKDLVDTGIRVSSIAPAVIETPMLGDMTQEHVDYMVSKIPLARLGRPEEVASLACFLASDDTDFTTGACFDLSGGRAVY